MDLNKMSDVTNIFPIIIKGFIVVGFIIIISCIIIGIYKIVKKKEGLDIQIGFGFVGILMWVGAAIFDYILNYDPFSYTETLLSLGFILSVSSLIFCYICKCNKKK